MSFLWAGEIMRLLFMIAINLHASIVSSRKHVSSSDESIENLLYYRDCNHKANKTPEPKAVTPEIEKMSHKQPDCPFPKMCCSMSCGDDCGSKQSFLSRQMEPLQDLQPSPPRQPHLPVQPQIMQRGRIKKKNGPMNAAMNNMQLPIGARRGLGFTKEKIKTLISQDDDIRKILKDLVRVTMQKVDLLEMVNSRRKKEIGKIGNSETSLDSEDYDSFVH